MPVLNAVSETENSISIIYPVTGMMNSFMAAAARALGQCREMPANVRVPPMEIRARGSVMEATRARKLSINAGRRYPEPDRSRPAAHPMISGLEISARNKSHRR